MQNLGFCPKRREGDISETYLFNAFNLGHFKDEGLIIGLVTLILGSVNGHLKRI